MSKRNKTSRAVKSLAQSKRARSTHQEALHAQRLELGRFPLGFTRGDHFVSRFDCGLVRYGTVETSVTGSFVEVDARFFSPEVPSGWRVQVPVAAIVELVTSEEFAIVEQRSWTVPEGESFQLWVDRWQNENPKFNSGMIDWVRTRPRAVQEMMLKFPPDCLVTATEQLFCPHFGSVGIVDSYGELTDGSVQLTVRQRPGPSALARCLPEQLRVVGSRGCFTSDWVREILDAPLRDSVKAAG